jgi:hypothetical protein
MICDGKHDLNNLNFLLSEKDIKHEYGKPIIRLRPTHLP